MNRALIYVHYNPNGNCADYVIYTLQAVRPLFEHIVVVSNSALKEEDKQRISKFSDIIYERENKGFDFGAWKCAFISEGWNKLTAFNSLTIMNDTCFGPIYDLHSIFNEMENNSFDFWGLTNYQSKYNLKALFKIMTGRTRRIKNHLQSYFLTFSKRVVNSQEFKEFWSQVHDKANVLDVIICYEEQLASLLTSTGFRCGVYIDTKGIKRKYDNLSIFHPDQLVIRGMPFIKVKSFLYNDNPKELLRLIEQKSDYNIDLIREHINEVFKNQDN